MFILITNYFNDYSILYMQRLPYPIYTCKFDVNRQSINKSFGFLKIMSAKRIDEFVKRFLSPENIDKSLLKDLKSEDGKLKWYGSLDKLKSFIEDKTSPSGSAKKFVYESDDEQFFITWYYKKQCSLIFQDNDAATNLKNKLIHLIDASEKSDKDIFTVDNDSEVLHGLDNTPLLDPTISMDEQLKLNLCECQEESVSEQSQAKDSVDVITSRQSDGSVKIRGCVGAHGLCGRDVEGIKLEVSILQSQLKNTNSFLTQSLNENKADCSMIKINKKILKASLDSKMN